MGTGLYDKAIHAVRYFLLRRLPTCKQMAPVMSESLERPLTLRERVMLKLHLWVCVWCVWYLENLRTMRSAHMLPTPLNTSIENSTTVRP